MVVAVVVLGLLEQAVLVAQVAMVEQVHHLPFLVQQLPMRAVAVVVALFIQMAVLSIHKVPVVQVVVLTAELEIQTQELLAVLHHPIWVVAVVAVVAEM
jgi:hypothetical protein